MSGDTGPGNTCPDELELLVFIMMGVMMAVDTAQIAGMLKPEEAQRRGVVATGLHQSLHFRDVTVRYEDPHVLLIRNDGDLRGIVIDRPQEIVSAKIDDVRPMPSLLAAAGGSKSLWGAFLRGDECIMLIDFYKLQEGP
ncbi:MAG: hypothetical protein HQL08_08800 [Nitrospirae bacterium]|nr:hypothetical protein [Nitrospirota bacterium]